jgi:hypothetical protein
MQTTEHMTPHALPVQTLPEKGPPPKERIGRASRVRALAKKLIENDDSRNKFDTRIRGMRDGNAPYARSALKRHAQAWRCNINWMEGKAIISAAMVPYYDLMAGSLHLAQVKVNSPDPFIATEKSAIVTEEWDKMLREWPAFNFNMDLAMTDRLTYGKGFLMWNDEYDPEFTWVNRFSVHVPDRTQACVDYSEVLVIEDSIPVDKLWRSINEHRAAERGWDIEECREAIRRADPETNRNDPTRHDLEQQKNADKDILDGISLPKVKAAHVFVREFDRKITHYLIELEGNEKAPSFPGQNTGLGDCFLFRKTGRFDDVHQCFWASFHESLDGSWNGASALGKEILPQIEVKNRVKCSIVDLGMMRSSIGMQATTEAAFGKMPVIQQGPITVFPPGLTPVPVATHVGDLEGVMALDVSIENTIGRNTGIYRQLPEKQQGNPLTATGEMLRTQQSAVLSNSAVIRFYVDLDRLYTELYRRTVKKCPAELRSQRVKDFIKRCEDRGVTEEELRDYSCVRAYRNVGNGSQVMRQQNLAQMADIVPLFPEKGKQAWVRETVSSLTNVDTADRFVPLDPRDEITLDHQIAMLENDSLVKGSPVMFAPDQNHVIHAQIHMQAAAQGIESIEQGAEPEVVLAALDGLMPHANMHIETLEGNAARKGEAKALRDQWNEIARITDQLRKAVDKIMQQRAEMADAERKAQAIRDQTDPETVIKAEETREKLRMSQERAQAKIQLDAQRQEAGIAMQDSMTAATITRANAETAARIELERRKAAAELGHASAGAGGRQSLAADKPKAAEKAGESVLNINVTGGEPAGAKKKKARKVTFERDAKGRISNAIVVDEDGGDGGAK